MNATKEIARLRRDAKALRTKADECESSAEQTILLQQALAWDAQAKKMEED